MKRIVGVWWGESGMVGRTLRYEKGEAENQYHRTPCKWGAGPTFGVITALVVGVGVCVGVRARARVSAYVHVCRQGEVVCCVSYTCFPLRGLCLLCPLDMLSGAVGAPAEGSVPRAWGSPHPVLPLPFSDIGLSAGFSEVTPPEAGPEPISPCCLAPLWPPRCHHHSCLSWPFAPGRL